jgi:copper(I)-binding protein
LTPYIAGVKHLTAQLCAAIVGVSLLTCAALAEGYSAGPIQIGNPWARATPAGARVGGGYLTITNKGSEPDRLLGGSLASATRFEVHTTVVEQGVAKMRPVENLEIKPGETIELSPGGIHVMFVGLKEPLKQGQRVKGALVFEKAGTVAVEFAVQPIGAPGPSSGGGHKGH